MITTIAEYKIVRESLKILETFGEFNILPKGNNSNDSEYDTKDVFKLKEADFIKLGNDAQDLFFNRYPSYYNDADVRKHIQSDYPTEFIEYDLLIPTQDWLDHYALKDYMDYDYDLGFNYLPIIIKHNDKYFIIDGHHRIAAGILTNKKIEVKVIDV